LSVSAAGQRLVCVEGDSVVPQSLNATANRTTRPARSRRPAHRLIHKMCVWGSFYSLFVSLKSKRKIIGGLNSSVRHLQNNRIGLLKSPYTSVLKKIA
jgi:hypothetical protein